ncbi:MAG: hypothetical protein H6Q68_1118 [Firmicutes bacterium]|nr:hypothetical protein [Bacillota bacterium]
MVENRDLKATPGIPDENRVVGEIPMKKAEYYGYFDPEPSTKEIIHQIEIAVNDSATKKKAKGKSNCPPPTQSSI